MYDATAIPSNPCPGACNAQWRRAEKQRLDKLVPHGLTARAGDPVFCSPCARFLRSALADLPELAARLQLEVENGSVGGGEHVSGSRERPVHQHQAQTFLIDDIDGILDDWATAVREDRNLASVRPLARGRRITASCRLLLIHFEWLIAEHPSPEASAAFGTDIGRIHRQASKLTHTHDVRAVPCDGVACRNCDLMTLEHEVDWQGRATGYIACRSCEVLLSAEEYERWLKMLAASLRKSAA